jgi:putative PEP-CTERM system TPR-repeat lipoprotein
MFRTSRKRRAGLACRILAWGAVAMALAVLAGCAGREERIDSGLSKAESFAAAADWDKAGLEARNVLQIDPRNARAYQVFGRVEEGRREAQRAFNAYRKALELDPALHDARVAAGRLLLLSGDVPGAEAEVQTVLASQPAHPGALTLRAALAAARGDAAAARRQAQDVLAANPAGVPDASVLLAGLLANAGDWRGAQQALDRALALAPGDRQLLQVAASIAAAPQAPPEVAARAEPFLRQAVERAPKDSSLWVAWAEWHVRQGQPDAAERVLRRAVDDEREDTARRLALLDFLHRWRGPDVALRGFDEAVQERPRDLDLRLAQAERQREAGRAEAADATLAAIVERAPTSPAALTARNRLALARLTAGQPVAAATLLEEVLAVNPRDATALLLRGRLRLDAGQPAQAVADLRAALRDQPASAEIVGRLAQAHSAAGEPALAREVLIEAVKFAPGQPDLRLLLAADHIDRREWRAAGAEIDTALRDAPRHLRAHEMKAALALAQGDRAGALRAWEQAKAQMPGEPAPHLRLGALLAQLQRPDAALREFDAAAVKFPQAHEPQLAAVALLVSLRRFDAAAARIEAMARAEPRNLLPHQLRGDLAMARGEPAIAQQHYARLVELAPTLPAGYLNAARARAALRDEAGALAWLQRGEEATGGDFSLALARADWLGRFGRFAEAISAYEVLHRRQPAHDAVANNLAFLLAETRDDRASLERALVLAERFAGSANPGFLDTLGWVRLRNGRAAQAVPVLERALAMAPGSALTQLHLGLALHEAGETARARDLLRAALQSGQPLARAEQARALIGG